MKQVALSIRCIRVMAGSLQVVLETNAGTEWFCQYLQRTSRTGQQHAIEGIRESQTIYRQKHNIILSE